MEKLSRKTIGILLALFVCTTASSCRLFKKKCDCPKWGRQTIAPADSQAVASHTAKTHDLR